VTNRVAWPLLVALCLIKCAPERASLPLKPGGQDGGNSHRGSDAERMTRR
jgi:hypothetical protein